MELKTAQSNRPQMDARAMLIDLPDTQLALNKIRPPTDLCRNP